MLCIPLVPWRTCTFDNIITLPRHGKPLRRKPVSASLYTIYLEAKIITFVWLECKLKTDINVLNGMPVRLYGTQNKEGTQICAGCITIYLLHNICVRWSLANFALLLFLFIKLLDNHYEPLHRLWKFEKCISSFTWLLVDVCQEQSTLTSVPLPIGK